MIKKISAAFLILLLCVSITLFIEDYNHKSLIPIGVYFGDIHIGGLTIAEARNELSKLTKNILLSHITLTFDDYKWSFKVSEHLEIDVNKSLENIIAYTQQGNVIERFALRQRLKRIPWTVNPVLILNEDNFNNTIKKINEVIFVEPKNAFFKIEAGKISIVDDVEGQMVDEDELKEKITANLWSSNRTLRIPIKKFKAEITKENLVAMNIREKVVEYSTKFNKSQKGRTENIKLAAERINGYILPPGDFFSFNQVVGERTRDRGYQEAPVFIDNQTVSDIGGGVCQVSSTLYNLALLANLEIIERINHSLPVSYVPLGRDATVNYDTIDLKFKNNTDGNLLLAAEVVDDTLTVKFFGKEKLPFTIEVISERVKTISPPITVKEDTNLPKGEIRIKQGSPGYVVKVWKTYISEEREEKVLVSTDTYNPTPTVLYSGVKAVENHESQVTQNGV